MIEDFRNKSKAILFMLCIGLYSSSTIICSLRTDVLLILSRNSRVRLENMWNSMRRANSALLKKLWEYSAIINPC